MIAKLKSLNLLILAARLEETLIEKLGKQLEIELAKIPNKDWAVATDIQGLKIKITNKGGRTKTTYRISLINNHFILAIELPQREVIDRFKADDKDALNKIVVSLARFQDDHYAKG